MNASGAARTEIDILDYSILIDIALKGKTAYLGETERGIPSKIYDIGSWAQYQVELGGLVTGNDFPLYCKRCLDAGGPLLIVPAGKYSDPSDKSTLAGIKAVWTQTQSSASAAGATATSSMTAVTLATGDTISVVAEVPGGANVTLATGVAATTDLATTAAALATAINGNTSTTHFSATQTGGVFTFTAPATMGAWGRNVKLRISSGAAATFNDYYPQFTGGSDTTVNTGTVTATALSKGTKYNDVRIAFATAASNDQSLYDITLTLLNQTALLPETIKDVPKLASDAAFAGKIAELIANSRMLSSLTFSANYVLQPGTFSLGSTTAGTNGSALVASDYEGDKDAQTNLYAFDNTEEAAKICIPAIADGALAKIVADYVDARKDMMGLHRTPVGLTTSRVLDYRYGTGSYTHTPIDSWRNLMFTGGLVIVHPTTKLPYTISEIGDVTAAIARKDTNTHEWFSFAGPARGAIGSATDVVTNVGTPGMLSVAGNYDRAGVIPVIKDKKSNIYIAGDNTLWRKDTLLKKSNVAELLTFMYRSLTELIPPEFEPNDVEYWKSVYRRVQPFLQYLEDNRAIWRYKYNGDQDIMDISQAVVNNPTNIDAGMYKVNIGIAPKVNAKYINIEVGVFNSGFDFNNITF